MQSVLRINFDISVKGTLINLLMCQNFDTTEVNITFLREIYIQNKTNKRYKNYYHHEPFEYHLQ